MDIWSGHIVYMIPATSKGCQLNVRDGEQTPFRNHLAPHLKVLVYLYIYTYDMYINVFYCQFWVDVIHTTCFCSNGNGIPWSSENRSRSRCFTIGRMHWLLCPFGRVWSGCDVASVHIYIYTHLHIYMYNIYSYYNCLFRYRHQYA